MHNNFYNFIDINFTKINEIEIDDSIKSDVSISRFVFNHNTLKNKILMFKKKDVSTKKYTIINPTYTELKIINNN